MHTVSFAPTFRAHVVNALIDLARTIRIGPWRRQVAVPGAAADSAACDDLIELDAATLRDIGAPDDLQARALARRSEQRQQRDALRIGLAAGDWRGW